MTRRTGTSLIEVLVTIGILGIGLISVIALFPMAAITMGQALKDDRTATCAATADGYIRNVHFRNVVEQTTPTEPYFFAMDGNQTDGQTPLSGTALGTGVPTPQLSNPSANTPIYPDSHPSYPVFVDPMGYATGSNAVGDLGSFTGGTYAIPRVTVQTIQSQATTAQQNLLALRLCSQMDGLTYNDDAVAQQGASMRELRYNWLWVLQRPTNSDRTTTTCTVVVFDRRVNLYKPPGSEAVFTTTFNPAQTSVTISSTADVRKGSWVMDGTITTVTDPDNVSRPIRHAIFYRVLSVNDNGNGSYTLELNTPITRLDGQTYPYTGNVVVMPAVADVYQRPVLSSTVGP
ncbi:type IV pilus modification PilV family protein [Frigoriglobus tundricola]|uniref:Uncharacterized protein n=1 Tax=Frigoriglobus tundricola TaxID=2774151 RepID=A0A6M5YTW6_9BACT|nr:prepilin-type N-terminal cleavage/methylation domain-containing protein [Frigoriglobus tundricola]QJW97478.1 hypothetical protein FTUN_5052 [Frigoriglobus tundricola]